MNEVMSLKQIRDEIGISRKAIQGYENHGLIRSCSRDKYGHLLYDEKTVERIIRIRFFQKLSFTVSEIKEFIDKNDEELIPILATRKICLREEINRLTDLYQELETMLQRSDLNKETILKIAKEDY